MNSLADLSGERQCHIDFYKCVWGEVSCPKCGYKKIKLRKNYEYCPHCKQKYSAKSETIFRNSNLSFKRIYMLIWCWQQKLGIGEVVKIIGMSYPTIERWFRRFRAALEPSDVVLEDVVEIDGSYFGRLRYGSQKLVVGAINPYAKRIILQVAERKDSKAVADFVNACIKKGSLIRTDGLPAYNYESLEGYDWECCDHDKFFFGPTNHIEGLWSSIKRALRHIYRDLTFKPDDLNLILREWENRYNKPYLFYNVNSYLKCRGCSKFVS